MGIIMSALAAAGDAGAHSMDQRIKQGNQIDLDERRSALETQKAKALIDYQKQASLEMDNTKRQGIADRIGAAKGGIISGALADKYAGSDAAVAAADAGQTGSQLTTEQQAAIAQSKSIDTEQIAKDPHTYIKAAMASGDIDPKEVAALVQQEDALRRGEVAQAAQFAHSDKSQKEQFLHADASQRAQQSHADAAQRQSQSFQASEGEKGRALTREYRMTDPTVVETNAQAIAAGNMPPLTGNALRSPGAAATMARVMAIKPDYSAKDYGTGAKAEKDFATGKQGNSVRSFNVALSHLDTLSGLADALNNKDTKAFNRLGNAIATQTGAPAPTNFEAVKHIVADELVKAVTGGAGALGDREAAAKTIEAANSPAQLRGVIASYKELMVGQIHGLRDQYKATTGKDDFDTKYLSGAARAVSHGGAAKPAGPTAPAVSAGTVDSGYRFKGGDPSNQANWEKI